MEINNEILNAFIYCQYKAYLKSKHQNGILSEYQTLYNQLKQNQKLSYEKTLLQSNSLISINPSFDNTISKRGIYLNFKFSNNNINLILDGIEFESNKKIIPIFITPFENITKYDKMFISLQAYYIKNEFDIQICSCKVIYGKFLDQTKFKIALSIKRFQKLVNDLTNTISDSVEPSLVLNSHCIICEYQLYCMGKAKADDNLSLLDRATTKVIEKYKKKGIFTIQQLSYLYRPRRRKKQQAKPLISHNIEIQALAIRTDKVLIQKLPELLKQPVEIFFDIEGNPDHESYYLIGLIVSKNQVSTSYSYWADGEIDEVQIWKQFFSKINEYPDSLLFHYGNYDSKAIEILGKRYKTSIILLQSRLINISSSIYGKIYFPVYSNKLKELGNYVGAKWTSQSASGIQTLVWRHFWEDSQDEKYKQLLITYNLEDCQALKLLTDKLIQIQELANFLPDIDFVYNPKKRSSPSSSQIHQQFDSILKFAHQNYDNSKISFQSIGQPKGSKENKVGGKIGHGGAFRAIPKAKKVIIVPRRRVCPKHNVILSESTREKAVTTITDLVFTKNTIRKTVIKYHCYPINNLDS